MQASLDILQNLPTTKYLETLSKVIEKYYGKCIFLLTKQKENSTGCKHIN